MIYKVWNKKFRRETTSEEKIDEHLERDMITEDFEEAKMRAFDLAEKRRACCRNLRLGMTTMEK